MLKFEVFGDISAYKYYCLLAYDAMQYIKTLPTFGATCCLHLQGESVEAECSSETSVLIYQTIRRLIREDSNHQNHCRENLKFCIL
jgi:hypothetical protein